MKNHIRMIMLGAILSTGASCGHGIKSTIDNTFVNYLVNEAGYTAIPMPSTLESGGSLVYIRKDGRRKYIQWVGDLLGCGMPKDIIYGGREAELRNGRFPTFFGSTNNDFGVGAALSIKGIGARADLKSIRKMVFTIDKSGHETIYTEDVLSYLAEAVAGYEVEQPLKPHCIDALKTQKVAVLVDVAYIDLGKVEFFKDVNASTKFSKPEIANILDMDAAAAAKVDSTGTMQIGERVYVAFKEAYYVPDEPPPFLGFGWYPEEATGDLIAALP